MSVKITVSGASGNGKTTIATLIQKYLKTLGFIGVTVELANNEMPPCPTDLRKSTSALINYGTKINIIEKPSRRPKP